MVGNKNFKLKITFLTMSLRMISEDTVRIFHLDEKQDIELVCANRV